MSEENKVTGKTNRIFAARGGFTLIELLVVIILIAVLSGMSVVVIRMAIGGGKASAVQMQLHQVSMALDNYKTKVGEYPPDSFLNYDSLRRHIKKRWPRLRYDSNSDGVINNTDGLIDLNGDDDLKNDSIGDINGDNTVDEVDAFLYRAGITDITGAQNASYIASLIFWLGGLQDANGNPGGFYLSPTDPLGILSDSNLAQREEIFFKFPEGTVVAQNGVPAFVPGKTDGKPVVYFAATKNEEGLGAYADPDVTTQTKAYSFNGELGLAVPYGKSNGQWYEQERFQLVHPGVDGQFSDPAVQTDVTVIRMADSQTNLSSFDDDNITSFSKGATLSSEY